MPECGSRWMSIIDWSRAFVEISRPLAFEAIYPICQMMAFIAWARNESFSLCLHPLWSSSVALFRSTISPDLLHNPDGPISEYVVQDIGTRRDIIVREKNVCDPAGQWQIEVGDKDSDLIVQAPKTKWTGCPLQVDGHAEKDRGIRAACSSRQRKTKDRSRRRWCISW